jgi:hypothetical protein
LGQHILEGVRENEKGGRRTMIYRSPPAEANLFQGLKQMQNFSEENQISLQ